MQRSSLLLAILIQSIAGFSLLPNYSTPSNDSRVIKIGLCLPRASWPSFINGGGPETLRIYLDYLSNRNTSLLPNTTVQLVEFDSGVAMAETYRNAIQQQSYNYAAMMGCGFSMITQPAALVWSSFGIPHCDGGITSPIFSSKENYPTLFRTVPSDAFRGEALANLLAYYKWNSRIAVFYSDEAFGLGTFTTRCLEYNMSFMPVNQLGLLQAFKDRSEKLNIKIEASPRFNPGLNANNTGAGLAAVRSSLSELKDKDIRIILVLGLTADIIQVMRQARSMQMTGQGYAWLVSGIDDAFSNGQMIDPDVAASLEGVLSLDVLYTTRPQMYQDFLPYWRPLIRQYNLTNTDDVPAYATFYMTCMELLLQGFQRRLSADSNATLTRLASGSLQWKVPQDFRVNGQETTSGPLQINENGDRSPMYTITNVQKMRLVQVGSVIGDSLNMTASPLFPGGSTSPPAATADYSNDNSVTVTLKSAVGMTAFILCCIGLVTCILVGALLAYYRTELKHTSPVLIGLFLIGIAFTFLSPMVVHFMSQEQQCVAGLWFVSLAYTFGFAALFVKNLRIYRIFTAKTTSVTGVSHVEVLIQFAILVLITLVPLIIASAAQNPRIEYRTMSIGATEIRCVYQNETVYTVLSYFLIAYFVILTAGGTYVTFAIRGVPARFGDSFHAGLCIYNISIVSLFLVLILSLLPTSMTARYALKAFGMIYLGYSNLIIFFLPKFRSVQHGNQNRSTTTNILSLSKLDPTDMSKKSRFETDRVTFSVSVLSNKLLNRWSPAKAFLISSKGDLLLSIGVPGSTTERLENVKELSALQDAHTFLISRCLVSKTGEGDTPITISTIEKHEGLPACSITFKASSPQLTLALASRLAMVRATVVGSSFQSGPFLTATAQQQQRSAASLF